MLTERRLREAELSPAVSAWLRSLGCTVYAECWGIDHIGMRDDGSLICVEMKTSLTRQVVRQAMYHLSITSDVYIATASRPRELSLERPKLYGIGVWAAGSVVLAPNPDGEYRKHISPRNVERIQRALRNHTPDGIGGLPTLKGDGPAIRCRAACREYLREHPAAGWRELFDKVPNHYAHYRSMRGAVGPIELLRPN